MKNIICIDGTCNEPAQPEKLAGDCNISNILKLHAVFGGTYGTDNVSNKNVKGQRSFYYRGVGTYGGDERIQFAFAPPDGDILMIEETVMADIKKHCKVSEDLFIFGFSRGAAIARRVAQRVKKEGGHRVKLLGVFDTVLASGDELDILEKTKPSAESLKEYNDWTSHIDKAVHLVSLDEKRLAFQPTLMNQDPKVSEVWFPGVHSDIGGGFDKDSLSDLTFNFMRKIAAESGLQILPAEDINSGDFEGEDVNVTCEDIADNSDHMGVMHSERRGIAGTMLTLRRRTVRTVIDNKSCDDMPVIHHSVFDRMKDSKDADYLDEYKPKALAGVNVLQLHKDGKKSIENSPVPAIKKPDTSGRR